MAKLTLSKQASFTTCNSAWAPGDATEPRKNATRGDEEEHSGSSFGRNRAPRRLVQKVRRRVARAGRLFAPPDLPDSPPGPESRLVLSRRYPVDYHFFGALPPSLLRIFRLHLAVMSRLGARG
jgi:hypothetical protein